MAITANFKKFPLYLMLVKILFIFLHVLFLFFQLVRWTVLANKVWYYQISKKSQHAVRAYHEWDKTVVCGQCLLCAITPVIPINLVLSVYHSNYFLHEWIILCTGLLWTICFIASLNYLLQGKFSVIQVILYCVDWKHNLHCIITLSLVKHTGFLWS